MDESQQLQGKGGIVVSQPSPDFPRAKLPTFEVENSLRGVKDVFLGK